MAEVRIHRNDVLKNIYFIMSMAQSQKGGAMHGALSSKGDLIGGIFDRWINVIPESIIFNKILIPEISGSKKVEVISDFYRYDPKEAGIAPDILGIKVNGNIVPFVKFDNKWTPVDGMPQIEIKTFKKPQKMVSLRNQGYDDEYLVMAETDLRIDYLIPFFNPDTTSNEVYTSLLMNDAVFIKNDMKNLLNHFSRLDTSDNTLLQHIVKKGLVFNMYMILCLFQVQNVLLKKRKDWQTIVRLILTIYTLLMNAGMEVLKMEYPIYPRETVNFFKKH